MIQEISLKEKQWERYDPESLQYICTTFLPLDFYWSVHYKNCLALQPDPGLLRQLKIGTITEKEYEYKYTNQIKNSSICQALIMHIKQEANEKPIYLITKNGDGLLLSIVRSMT